MDICTINYLDPFAKISKFNVLLITSQGSVAARSLSDLRNNLETSLLKGIAWHAARRRAGEPNRPQAVHYLWTKMIDLLSYLHTSNMSGSPFQTALGCFIAIHPPKFRVRCQSYQHSKTVSQSGASAILALALSKLCF